MLKKMWGIWNPHIFLAGKKCAASLENRHFFKIWYIEPLYDKAIAPLGIYPRQMKTYIHKNLMHRYIMALVMTFKKWNNPHAHQLRIRFLKKWKIRITGYYPIIKRNNIRMHRASWTKHESFILSERSQT